MSAALDLRPVWADEEIDAWRETVVRFVEDEMAPADAKARAAGRVDMALWRRAGELGLLCTDIPAEYGAAGGDFRHEAVIHEEMARRSLTSMNPSVHAIVAHYLLNHGTPAQRDRWLPSLVRGEKVGAIAMTEPAAGSDLQGIRTRARRNGDAWVIQGSKTFISNGALAGLVLVVARTDPEAGSRGFSIFIVDTADAPGYRVGQVLHKIGLKGQDTAELFFDELRVHDSALLGGEPGRGFAQLMSDLPYERTIIALAAVAAAEGALDATIAYVKERQAFGKPLFQQQALRFKLAELAAQVKVGRVFVDRCVQQLVAGTLDTTTASIGKLWASEMQGRVVDECLQMFGGYGYMEEYLIGRMYGDSRIQRIYGGTSEIMKEIIARAL